MNQKRLAAMIRRRDRLASELAEAERRVRAAVNEFGKEQGYLIPLRLEQVRPLLGMDNPGEHHRTTH